VKEDKTTLLRQRAELVQQLSTPIGPGERLHVQNTLSVVNAKIKELNTIEAAQQKTTAVQRRAAGLAEAQANAQRARANAGLPPIITEPDDDPGQVRAVDDWFTRVLTDSGIVTKRKGDKIAYQDVPAGWVVLLQRLRAGLHAAASGEELPEAEIEPERPAKRKKR
jgi:hypothetical protein